MLGENLSQERGLVEWAVCERGRGEVFGQAREGFMEEVSFYQKPIETRDLALQIFRKGGGGEHSRQRNRKCKDPGMGTCSEHKRSIELAMKLE